MSDGTIYNQAKLAQQIAFEGLNYKKMSLTDIDGFMSLSTAFGMPDSQFMFMEVKENGKKFNRTSGQTKALTALVDGLAAENFGVLFCVWHHEPNVRLNIKAEECTVVHYYTKATGWKSDKSLVTMHDAYMRFIEKAGRL
jgi:hypothetical protein